MQFPIFLYTLAVLLQAQQGESGCLKKCNPYTRFRTFSGVCNNLLRPFDGAAGSAFGRLIPPAYDDGFDSPRQNGLPNPRKLSLALFQDNSVLNANLSHMAMTFGQFLAHDVTGLGQPERLLVDCEKVCEKSGTSCFGVRVDDPLLRFTNNPEVDCIVLRRTTPVREPTRYTAPRKPRQQVNTLTAFIDASQVYGVEEDVVEAVRDLEATDGTLRTVPHPVNRSPPLREILPPNFVGQFCRSPQPKERPCPLSGDFLRTTENQALGTMHTLWAREHNRIAKRLREINPQWNSYRVFQEARKILGAIMQHVTYNEWLPAILNEATRTKFKLNLLENGFFRGYIPNLSANLPNSMATAALRFGHSLIQNRFTRRDVGGAIQPSIPTKDFFNPVPLTEADKGGLDAIVRGLATLPAQAVDSNIARAVTQTLVQEPGVIAADLVALNIQRGRDHGLPSYNTFRQRIGLGKALSFADFYPQISYTNIGRLKKVYASPDDVDVFVGGLSETRLNGAQLGPTFSWILAASFKILRFADRFWYETANPVTGFTFRQLQELRNANIARLICDNSDGITQMQVRPFQQQGPNNVVKLCNGANEHPRIDLTAWTDTRKDSAASA